MIGTSFTSHVARSPVVRLRTGRIVLLGLLIVGLFTGGGLWLLKRRGTPVVPPPVETVSHPAWMKQSVAYAADEPRVVQAPLLPTDPMPALQRQLAAMQRDSEALREELETLKRRPAPVIPPPAAPPKPTPVATPPPPRKPPGAMLFISHDKELKEVAPTPKVPEYTLAPGATKIPFVLETKIISDVEGYLTGRVTTNVFDSATGRHLLIPQGSTILGNTQSSKLVYGNERMDTVTLKLALPDGRSIDLDRAPITDQEGVSGLGGDVNQHYWRLLAAVLIQGVLKGGATAVSTAASSAAGAGQIASGIAGAGSQTGTQITGPLLNTRPTITTEAGQLANIILLQPLRLPAMWQNGEPHDPTQTVRR
jgi:type IV secretory pathway VirB10-like protein